MATQAVEISQPQLRTKFEVEIEEPFALSLKEWFEKACEGDNIDKFAAEVLEAALAQYRLEQLPPGEEDDHDSRRQKLTPFQEAEIFECYADGDCGVSELALRYEVHRSSILRVVKKHGAIKRKPPLTAEQIAEIRRLHAEGATWVELAKRFDRANPCSLSHIVRKKVAP
jgi:transposase-like protein